MTRLTPQHFSLHEIVDGVWAAQGELTGITVGNAAIVDLGDKTIVFDTFMTDVAAQELRETAEALTGRRVWMAVNSHWHGDHTYGNQVFGDVPIAATETTLKAVEEEAPRDVAAWAEQIEASLEGLAAAAEGGDPGAVRRLDNARVFRAFAGRFQLTPPTRVVDGSMTIEGERTAVIATKGRGHTVSDVYLWIPQDRVLLSGDLCWNSIHPRTWDGFPVDWAAYTHALIDLDPQHVIPGHGAPGGPDLLTDLPNYFTAVAEMVEQVQSGTDPAEIEPPAMSADWAGVERFRRGLRNLADR